jgi:hypothetical protein
MGMATPDNRRPPRKPRPTSRCARCLGAGPLTEAYWGGRYCRQCCLALATEHDLHDTWPELPDGWDDEGAML